MRRVMCACVVLFVVTSTALADPLFYDGFEDGTAGDWTRLTGPALSISSEAAYGGSYGAQMAAYSYAAGGYLRAAPVPHANELVFSFAVCWSSDSALAINTMSNVWGLYNVNGKSAALGIGTTEFSTDGESIHLFVHTSDESYVILGDATAETWYSVQAYIDVDDNAADWYVNGNLLLANAELPSKIWDVMPNNSVAFGGGGNSYTVAKFDEFSVVAVPVPGAALLACLGLATVVARLRRPTISQDD